MKPALLLVDLQKDYFPGGRMALAESEAAVEHAAEVLSHCRLWSIPVIHIQHASLRPGSTLLVPGSAGAEIHERVAPLPSERVFEKCFPNSFRETPLLEHLRSNAIDTLAIAGMTTSMCVDATARAAFDSGFQLFLLHEAMAASDLFYNGELIPASHVHGAFLSALGSTYGRVCTIQEFIQAEFLHRIGAAKQPNPATLAAEERRRSQRLQRTVSILVMRRSEATAAETENISAHGALVNSPQSYPQGVQVVLVNEILATKTEGWVVWSRPANRPGRFTLGIEFLKPIPSFWGSAYTP